MQPVEIYGRKINGADCPWCVRARALCERLNIPFVYRDITDDPELQLEFTTRTNGAATVPQIFVGMTRIGGFDALAQAHRTGALQQMIGGE